MSTMLSGDEYGTAEPVRHRSRKAILGTALVALLAAGAAVGLGFPKLADELRHSAASPEMTPSAGSTPTSGLTGAKPHTTGGSGAGSTTSSPARSATSSAHGQGKSQGTDGKAASSPTPVPGPTKSTPSPSPVRSSSPTRVRPRAHARSATEQFSHAHAHAHAAADPAAANPAAAADTKPPPTDDAAQPQRHKSPGTGAWPCSDPHPAWAFVPSGGQAGPSVWDRVFDPVSRAKLDQDPLDTIRLSSKPFNHIVRARPCQPAHPTAFPPVFHMRNLLWTRLPGSSTSIVEERPFRAASDLHLEGFSPCRARTLRSAQRYGLPLQRRQVRRTPKRKTEN